MPCPMHLSSAASGLHAVLAPLIQKHSSDVGLPEELLPTETDSAFHALAHVIMGQQLSLVSVRNIAQKVKDACGVSCLALSSAPEHCQATLSLRSHLWLFMCTSLSLCTMQWE